MIVCGNSSRKEFVFLLLNAISNISRNGASQIAVLTNNKIFFNMLLFLLSTSFERIVSIHCTKSKIQDTSRLPHLHN